MPPERSELTTFAIGQFQKIKTGEISSFPNEDQLAQRFGYKPPSIRRVLASIGITKDVIENERVELLRQPSIELAWMLGIISGDGFIGKEYDRRISLTRSSEPELLKEFQTVGQRLFGKEPKVKPNNVSFFSTKIISALGDLRNNSWPETISLKHVWVLNYPIHTWKFIEGLFDAKGNLQTKPEFGDNSFYFRTNNLTSADFIKKLLLSVGLTKPTVHSTKTNEQAIYKVGIYNINDLEIIACRIHPKSTNKQKQLRALRETPDPLTDEKTIWDYALKNNLIPIISAQNLMSEKELAEIRDLFQTKAFGERSERLLDKFTLLVANLAK